MFLTTSLEMFETPGLLSCYLPGCIYLLQHYENMPMQYTEIFKVVKNEKFQQKMFVIFLIFAQNIDCGYMLEPPQRGGSNELPQSMFWSKNKKDRCALQIPVFLYKSGGSRG